MDRLRTINENQYLHILGDDNSDDLPDRIVNPDMYQPLLQADNGEENCQNDTQPQASINSLVDYGPMSSVAFFQQANVANF